MYKDDYVSAFGKLAPSEAWKADTLAKMRALEARRADPFASDAAIPEAPARRAVPFAARVRRAALPVAALVMLAILPVTTLRGCGASGGNASMNAAAYDGAAPQMQTVPEAVDGSYSLTGAPEAAPRDAAGGAYDTAAPAGEGAPRDAASCDSAPCAAAAESFAGVGGTREKSEFASGEKPFGTLAAADLCAASVRFEISDQVARIADYEELAALLNDVTVREQDDFDAEQSGEGFVFTLTFADGTQTEVRVYPAFLVIDGAGYRAEAEACEALSRCALRLLEDPPARP